MNSFEQPVVIVLCLVSFICGIYFILVVDAVIDRIFDRIKKLKSKNKKDERGEE